MDQVNATAQPAAATTAGDATISQRLADYWAAASFDDLPPVVLAAAKRFLLDTLAAGVAGGNESVVSAVVDGARAAAGSGDAVLWGRRDRLPPAAAA
ncbi:MAG TPA: MmgE/PrpD family protein, partial [Vineibacter sp.]|nr:MmgE/PrpD family protein [Vineibacter sp.]